MKSSRPFVALFVASLLLGPVPSLRAADSIDRIVAPGTRAEVLGTGYGFAEGPAADAEGNVYFSDGRNDSIHFYRVGSEVELFVGDGTDANGMMFNRQGELVACEGAGIKVYSSSGESVGVIGPDQGVPHASNCCFGGPDFGTLYITSRDKFLGLKTKVRGIQPLPARR